MSDRLAVHLHVHAITQTHLQQYVFVAVCACKLIAISVLCYRAYLPFRRIVTKNKFVQASKRAANSTSKKNASDSARIQQQRLSGNSKQQPTEPRSKSVYEHQLQQQQQAPIEGSRSQTSERSNIVSGASFVSVGEESPMELELEEQSLSTY
jgi:hypothetical protein